MAVEKAGPGAAELAIELVIELVIELAIELGSPNELPVDVAFADAPFVAGLFDPGGVRDAVAVTGMLVGSVNPPIGPESFDAAVAAGLLGGVNEAVALDPAGTEFAAAVAGGIP